jgi:hypothetical protein
VLLELGLARATRARPGWRRGLAAALALAMVAAPVPVTGQRWKSGVADERDHYQARDRAASRRDGERLRELFRGLPVRAAFVGTQAILAYYSQVPVAIEATAGLTDSFVARQRLERRGRPGHEKQAPYPYLVERRRAHFILVPARDLPDTLASAIPLVAADLGGVEATVLHWDEPLMRELSRRGARVMDFVATLDAYLAAMPSLPDSAVRADYAKLGRYYFDAASDSAREGAFRRRLGL